MELILGIFIQVILLWFKGDEPETEEKIETIIDL